MRVLVIGGTEFISHHLVHALRRDGHEVTVLNRGRHPERLPGGVRTIVADRKDHAALARAVAGERVDGLVDVAYAPTTGEDVEAVYDCHAVYTTTRLRSQLGRRPRYSLTAGLAQTFAWYLGEGLDRHEIDFAAEDRLLAGCT